MPYRAVDLPVELSTPNLNTLKEKKPSLQSEWMTVGSVALWRRNVFLWRQAQAMRREHRVKESGQIYSADDNNAESGFFADLDAVATARAAWWVLHLLSGDPSKRGKQSLAGDVAVPAKFPRAIEFIDRVEVDARTVRIVPKLQTGRQGPFEMDPHVVPVEMLLYEVLPFSRWSVPNARGSDREVQHIYLPPLLSSSFSKSSFLDVGGSLRTATLPVLAAFKAAHLTLPSRSWTKHICDFAAVRRFLRDEEARSAQEALADRLAQESGLLPQPIEGASIIVRGMMPCAHAPYVFASRLVEERVEASLASCLAAGSLAAYMAKGRNEVSQIERAKRAFARILVPDYGITTEACAVADDPELAAKHLDDDDDQEDDSVSGCRWSHSSFLKYPREVQLDLLRVRVGAASLLTAVWPKSASLQVNEKAPGPFRRTELAREYWLAGLRALLTQPSAKPLPLFGDESERARFIAGAEACRVTFTGQELQKGIAETAVFQAVLGNGAFAHRDHRREVIERAARSPEYKAWLTHAWLRLALLEEIDSLIDPPSGWFKIFDAEFWGEERFVVATANDQEQSLLASLPDGVLGLVFEYAAACAVRDLGSLSKSCLRFNALVKKDPTLWLTALVSASARSTKWIGDARGAFAIGWHEAVGVDIGPLFNRSMDDGEFFLTKEEWLACAPGSNWQSVARDLLGSKFFAKSVVRRPVTCMHCGDVHRAVTSNEHNALMEEYGDDEGYMAGLCVCKDCYDTTGSWTNCPQNELMVRDDFADMNLRENASDLGW